MIRILLVDDHAILRSGIRRILEADKGFEVVGEASHGEEAVKLAKELNPHVVLMDLKMPGMDGLEATRRILRYSDDIKVLVLTSLTNSSYASRVLKTGASGYILKGAEAEELVTAIKKVYSGQRYLSSETASKLAYKNINGTGDSLFDALSRQEMQIVLSVIRGEKTNVIAKRHHISTKTVNTYRYRAFDKLGVKNNVQLSLLAVQEGLLDADEVALGDE